MAKQPYIPFYPGDWERDTNCLSSEAEYGLFKLTIKLSDAKVSGRLKTSFRTLATLFKKNIKFAKDVISELMDNDILNITINSDSDIEIVSRRLTKKAEISETRAEIGKKGGVAKSLNNGSKTLPNDVAKPYQIPDNDIEDENEEEEYVRDEKFEKSILEYFGFKGKEIAHPEKERLVFQFCFALNNKNHLEPFKPQFAAYCEYKNITKFKHNFDNFLGKQSECFTDGAWNKENWVEKLKEVKPSTSTGKPKPIDHRQQSHA